MLSNFIYICRENESEFEKKPGQFKIRKAERPSLSNPKSGIRTDHTSKIGLYELLAVKKTLNSKKM
jgi:hypothetical protein